MKSTEFMSVKGEQVVLGSPSILEFYVTYYVIKRLYVSDLCDCCNEIDTDLVHEMYMEISSIRKCFNIDLPIFPRSVQEIKKFL